MRRLLFTCGLCLVVAGFAQADPKGSIKPAGHQEVIQVPTVAVPPPTLTITPNTTLPPAPYATSPGRIATLDSPIVPFGEAKPARFPQSFLQQYPYVRPPVSQGHALHSRILDTYCAPDGCPTPLGCGNCYTDFIFVFGSCRQFFGTAESTVGKHKETRIIQK